MLSHRSSVTVELCDHRERRRAGLRKLNTDVGPHGNGGDSCEQSADKSSHKRGGQEAAGEIDGGCLRGRYDTPFLAPQAGTARDPGTETVYGD